MTMLLFINTIVMNINEVMKCLKCCWLNHIRPPLEEVRNTFNRKSNVLILHQEETLLEKYINEIH